MLTASSAVNELILYIVAMTTVLCVISHKNRRIKSVCLLNGILGDFILSEMSDVL